MVITIRSNTFGSAILCNLAKIFYYAPSQWIAITAIFLIEYDETIEGVEQYNIVSSIENLSGFQLLLNCRMSLSFY